MYHYLLRPQPPARHLIQPCHRHHHLEPSASSDACSKRPPRLPAAAPVLREEEPLPEKGKSYATPSMPCSGYHQYPFPSLLLIDLPALWQPSLTASRVATSRAAPHPSPRSPPPDVIHQNQKQALQGQAPPSDPSPGTSKTLRIPSTVGECNKPTSSTLKRQDTTILYLARPQPSRARNPPRQYLLSRPHLSRPPVPSRIVPDSTRQD